MGTIRKHEVRTLVASSLVLLVVLAAAIICGTPGTTSGSTARTQDAVAIDDVQVIVTGHAERTPTGHAVPVSVTNERDEAVSIKDMKIVVTLTDLSKLNATCHGPDSVAPGATAHFLIIIDVPRDIEIFVIDLVRGGHYLRAVMPVVPPALPLPDLPQVEEPDDDNTPTQPQDNTTVPEPPAKTEPAVTVSLSDDMPLRPAYYEGNPPFFGEPASGQVIAQVSSEGDPADVGVYIYFPGLGAEKVSVNASYADGAPVPVQLVSDGVSGCYGLLVHDPSATGSNWTWHYGGVGTEYHNISIAVTTYQLGTHELRLYAYDAGTGARISEVVVTSYTVYGSGGPSSELRMFDTEMTTDMADPFVPGSVYNITFRDTCRYDGYQGTVRSFLKLPYAANVWLVENGSEVLLTPNSLGEYVITWTSDGGAHDLHLRVQLGEEGGSYPPSAAQYWLEDSSTGMVLSPVDGEGVAGITFPVRGPETDDAEDPEGGVTAP